MKMTNEQQALKITQVADRLNCGKANVHALIEKGELAAVCTAANGKGARVLDKDLVAFIESRRTLPR